MDAYIQKQNLGLKLNAKSGFGHQWPIIFLPASILLSIRKEKDNFDKTILLSPFTRGNVVPRRML
jgi:hypothetical protein